MKVKRKTLTNEEIHSRNKVKNRGACTGYYPRSLARSVTKAEMKKNKLLKINTYFSRKDKDGNKLWLKLADKFNLGDRGEGRRCKPKKDKENKKK